MSKVRGQLAIIRDNVGKILDVYKKPENTPEKQVQGKFVSIKFPIIKRGTLKEGVDETPQSE